MKQKIITLLSDFGLKDPYVAEMKAVILSICPEAKIVDVSHEILKFDTRMGAFVLASAVPYFPKGTVHVAVVDPGVRTKRRPTIVETKHGYFVGPDNGILMLAAFREGLDHVYVIENPQYMLQRVSRTFHGRDVFAPTAAHLAKGVVVSEFGQEIKDYVVPDFAKSCLKSGVVFGEVLYIDDFGNIITNISSENLKELAIHEQGALIVEIDKKAWVLRLCSAYGDVSRGESLVVMGSHDFLEISINQGNAAEKLKVETGDSVHVHQ
jgi:S-adenosylmethionine hydrolase